MCVCVHVCSFFCIGPPVAEAGRNSRPGWQELHFQGKISLRRWKSLPSSKLLNVHGLYETDSKFRMTYDLNDGIMINVDKCSYR